MNRSFGLSGSGFSRERGIVPPMMRSEITGLACFAGAREARAVVLPDGCVLLRVRGVGAAQCEDIRAFMSEHAPLGHQWEVAPEYDVPEPPPFYKGYRRFLRRRRR